MQAQLYYYLFTDNIQLLYETFSILRVFSRFSDQNWPPRTCDLTPLDFFLCYLKSKIYVNNSTTTRALQEEINVALTKFSHNYGEWS